MRTLALLSLSTGLAVMLAGSAVVAADLALRGPGCSHIATVQYLDCQVSVLYACPGPKMLATPLVREESYTPDGYESFEVDTAHGGMVVTGDAAGSYVLRTDLPTMQETPMAEVLAKGRGSFSGKGTLTISGATKPAGQAISIKANGETPELSGIPTVVFMAEVAVDLPEPIGPSVSTSKAYLVPSLGIYLAGEVVAGTYFKTDDTPHRPMSVALPGHPGFDVTRPGFCGGSLSLFSPGMPVPNVLNGVPA